MKPIFQFHYLLNMNTTVAVRALDFLIHRKEDFLNR